MQSKTIRYIRSRGFSHINGLVRAHKHLQVLRPAFAEWRAGEIYVCQKTGDYRHRYGAQSKHVTSWSAAAREVFPTPAAFALAALVFAADKLPSQVKAAEARKATTTNTGRADVVRIAIAGRAA